MSSSSNLPRSHSLPTALADAPADLKRYTPEQAAAAKAARRASMLNYARRMRQEEQSANERAAAVRFLSPLPGITRCHSSSSSLSSVGAVRQPPSEDPFSLSGFFPSRPGSPTSVPVSVASAWLGDEEEELPHQQEEEARHRLAPQKKSLSMSALDDYAKSVIADEGRVGILSLGRSRFW